MLDMDKEKLHTKTNRQEKVVEKNNFSYEN